MTPPALENSRYARAYGFDGWCRGLVWASLSQASRTYRRTRAPTSSTRMRFGVRCTRRHPEREPRPRRQGVSRDPTRAGPRADDRPNRWRGRAPYSASPGLERRSGAGANGSAAADLAAAASPASTRHATTGRSPSLSPDPTSGLRAGDGTSTLEPRVPTGPHLTGGCSTTRRMCMQTVDDRPGPDATWRQLSCGAASRNLCLGISPPSCRQLTRRLRSGPGATRRPASPRHRFASPRSARARPWPASRPRLSGPILRGHKFVRKADKARVDISTGARARR